MTHRIGISLETEDLKRLRQLQKQWRIKSRSQVIRELVRRDRKAEEDREFLRQVAEGYRRIPEDPKENEAILKALAKDMPPW